jgi:hypothetical protein
LSSFSEPGDLAADFLEVPVEAGTFGVGVDQPGEGRKSSARALGGLRVPFSGVQDESTTSSSALRRRRMTSASAGEGPAGRSAKRTFLLAGD